LEHLAATSLLPLARISKFFCCKLHAQHPSWQPRCKNQQINKAKRQLHFPQKTKSPSGATAGGIRPPKNGPIFSQKKIRKRTKYDSTLASSVFRRGAGGQAERTREPEIAYTFARIRPFSLASGPAGYSRNRTSPTRIHPGKGKNRIARQAKQETPLTFTSA
jgi:hypothetical protein